MTASETSRLLSAAAHSAQAAAELLLVLDMSDSPFVLEMVERSQQLLAFARECGSVPKREL